MAHGLLAALLLTGVPAASATPVGAQSTTVELEASPGYGVILTDPEGWTLYTWDGDTEGQSNCYDACAAEWPPYTIDSAPVAPDGLPGGLGLIDRGDGTWQVSFNDWPLYYFSGDTAPGDTNGDGTVGFDAQWYATAFPAPTVAAPPAPELPAASPSAPPAEAAPSAPAVLPGLGAIPAGSPADQALQPPSAPAEGQIPQAPGAGQYPFNGPPDASGPGILGAPFGGPPLLLPPPAVPPLGGEGYAPTVTVAAPPNGNVSLNWIATPNAQSYRIYQTLASQPLNFSVQQTINQAPGQLVTNATIASLTPGALYYFQVRAVDLSGQEIPAPAVASALPAYGSVVLGVPGSLAATGVSGTTAQLSWTSVPGATSYRVWQASSPVGPFVPANVNNMTSTGAIVTGLSPNSTYYFQVAAIDMTGNQSPPSPTVAGSTTPVLAAPTSVIVATSSPTSAMLTWGAVAGAASYQISQASSFGGPYTPVATVGGTAHSAVISGLQPSSAYYFQVTAVDAVGNPSPASGSAMGMTSAPSLPPLPPAPPTPTATTPTPVTTPTPPVGTPTDPAAVPTDPAVTVH